MSTKCSMKGGSKMREWLKILRENKKMTQEYVANKAEMSRQHYGFIENGNRRPSPQVAKRIADTLGFSDEWYRLLEETSNPA
jgi:putative transcriptional regulator